MAELSKTGEYQEQSADNVDWRKLPRGPKSYQQACHMERVAYKLATDPETPRSVVAQLMRAWTDIQERKRIMKMKPKPKDIDVSARRSKSSAQILAPAV